MPVDPRKAGKALKAVVQGANASSDTPLSSFNFDDEVIKRVVNVLEKMGYATVTDGNIRLTEAGEAQKNA